MTDDGENSLYSQAVNMRVPVLAFAFCMFMAPCASNALTLEDYDKLSNSYSKDSSARIGIDGYLTGIARAFTLMNSLSDRKFYCPPENLLIEVSVITQSIKYGRKTIEKTFTREEANSSGIEIMSLMGLQEIFPCRK